MAKSMALIENGTITNMLWCSDAQPETASLINPQTAPWLSAIPTAMVNFIGTGWKSSPRWKKR